MTQRRTRNTWKEVPDEKLHWTSEKYSIAGVGGPEEAMTREELMRERERD